MDIYSFQNGRLLQAVHDHYEAKAESIPSISSCSLSPQRRVVSKSDPARTSRISHKVSFEINGDCTPMFFLKTEYHRVNKLQSESFRDFRWGFEYESWLYREILNRYKLLISPLYIDCWWCENEDSFSFLMTALNGDRIAYVPQFRQAMIMAAEWLGEFQRKCQLEYWEILAHSQKIPSFTYDYLANWFSAALEIFHKLPYEIPWLNRFDKASKSIIDALIESPQTLVHGDYYPNNILLGLDGIVYPIDWEAASLGPGIVDICSLVQFWPLEMTDYCLSAYCKCRWPSGVPSLFSAQYQAGRIYQLIRGDWDKLLIRRGEKHLAQIGDALNKFESVINSP